MKKLYISALIAAAMMSCHARVSHEEIDDLIETSSMGRLKALLKKFDRQSKKKQLKMKAYYSFYDAACEMVDQRKESMWVFGCWQDAAKTVSGSILGLGGFAATTFGFALSSSLNNEREEAFASAIKIGGVVVTPIGLYLLYRGLTCSTQQSRHQDAQEVEEYLDKRIIELEKPAVEEVLETKDNSSTTAP